MCVSPYSVVRFALCERRVSGPAGRAAAGEPAHRTGESCRTAANRVKVKLRSGQVCRPPRHGAGGEILRRRLYQHQPGIPLSAGPQVPRSDVALVLNRGFGDPTRRSSSEPHCTWPTDGPPPGGRRAAPPPQVHHPRVQNQGSSGGRSRAEPRCPHPTGRRRSEISCVSRLCLRRDSGPLFFQPLDSRVCQCVGSPARGLDLALHTPGSTGGHGAAGAGASSVHEPTAPVTREGCDPVGEEGGPMNSIVYLVGAVVIIGVALKMLGVY